MTPCRFARAYLGRDFVQALDNTGVFPAGFASPQPKSAPRKLRSTCEPVIIEGFLLPTSAAGLTPGKGGGTKRPEKSRSQAVGVRVLSPSSFLPSTRKILGPAQRPRPLGMEFIQASGRRGRQPVRLFESSYYFGPRRFCLLFSSAIIFALSMSGDLRPGSAGSCFRS